MNFPIIDPPINSTTAFVLQKTKPTQNDLDRHLADLRMFQTTYKRILCGKNTPERKQQLRGLGLKIQSIQNKIHNCRKLLNQTKDTIKVWLLAIVLSLLFYVSFWVFVRIVAYSLEPF